MWGWILNKWLGVSHSFFRVLNPRMMHWGEEVDIAQWAVAMCFGQSDLVAKSSVPAPGLTFLCVWHSSVNGGTVLLWTRTKIRG